MSKPSFQAPKGTRDAYPADMLRRRYITDAWRRVALRHGFDEIDGPTFENASLYAVKSGEGILGEMFGVYSGKDPDDIKLVQQGAPPFALRPEFTPTLARMYAARARQLPQPTKWFCVSNFFRAERPQRGRLREFLQFNADFIGDLPAVGDAEVLHCIASLMTDLGLSPANAVIGVNHRTAFAKGLIRAGVTEDRLTDWMVLIDRRNKMTKEQYLPLAFALAADQKHVVDRVEALLLGFNPSRPSATPETQAVVDKWVQEDINSLESTTSELNAISSQLEGTDVKQWIHYAPTVIRGLAYYTGTVFEVIAEGERAVAGGGRYDNLIELFGGPPTPACGFGMGDVVLGNLLDDKGLIPEGPAMLDALSRPMPVRPDAFVVAANDDATHITPLVARLRRGMESPGWLARDARKPWDADRYTAPPLHARRTYKSTRNIGKLLADASACHARWAVIIENAEVATLKNLDTREERKGIPLEAVALSCH